MTKLSVNINKIATLRNARGGNVPDVVKVALDCESFGADGITVHPRPDERHIRRSDVYDLRPLLRTEFNIEGYPSPEFIDLVLKVKPHQVTLVPDDPSQITSSLTVPAFVLPFLWQPILKWWNMQQKQGRIASNCILNLMRRTIRRIRKQLSLLLSKLQRLLVNWVSD